MFDPNVPTWNRASIGADVLRDTDTISESEHKYYSISAEEYLQVSADNDYPTKYKFHSMDFILAGTN